MRLVTFETADRERFGVLTAAGIVDLAAAANLSGKGESASVADVLAFLEAGAAGRDLAATLTNWALSRGDDDRRARCRNPPPRADLHGGGLRG